MLLPFFVSSCLKQTYRINKEAARLAKKACQEVEKSTGAYIDVLCMKISIQIYAVCIAHVTCVGA